MPRRLDLHHSEAVVGDPPVRLLLCMHPDCHGEFYLPLSLEEAIVCPNDREHTVALYQAPSLHRGDRD